MLYQADIQKFLLVRYQSAWENEPTKWFSLNDLIKEKDFKFLNKWEIKTIEDLVPYILDLNESNFLNRMRRFFKITKQGRNELDTTYNRSYINKEQQIKNEEILAEKQEREKDRKERRLQHDEMVQVAKDANKWTKKGMILAIGLGIAGIVIAIFLP